MKKISVLILSLLSTVCLSNLAVSVYWNEKSLRYGLPKFMHNFKNELALGVTKEGQIEINYPEKKPSYWLAPKDAQSDKKIATLLATLDLKKAPLKSFKALLKAIKTEYPNLKGLYESLAYITENHTLEEHTLDVLKQFNSQKQFYPLNAPCYKRITQNMEQLMIATILVHDIGKPLGVRKKQHEHTRPLAKKALKKWGFSQTEVAFSLTLIDNDVIGELVQPQYKAKVQDAYDALDKLSKKVGLSIEQYFELQTLFYVSDASSYPYIKSVGFREDKRNGRLYSSSKKFWQLSNLSNKPWRYQFISALYNMFTTS